MSTLPVVQHSLTGSASDLTLPAPQVKRLAALFRNEC